VVVAAPQRRDGGVEPGGVELALGGRERRGAGEPRQDPPAGLLDLGALLDPRLGHADDDLRPRGHPLARLRRPVRAGVERNAIRREERVQRPAAAAGHRLDRVHVDRVDVRALLAVDFDADKALVHQRRDLGVLERLALHHVAPVARRVADRDEDRLLLGPRPGQRLLAPRVPVDRVVRVLEEVGGRLCGESVGHRWCGLLALASSRERLE
jgi:hypothetical protein